MQLKRRDFVDLSVYDFEFALVEQISFLEIDKSEVKLALIDHICAAFIPTSLHFQHRHQVLPVLSNELFLGLHD